MKNLINIFCAGLICLAFTGSVQAQTKAEIKAQKAADLKRIIDGKSYVFRANAAMPTNVAGIQVSGGSLGPNSIANQLNGGLINLTSSYDVKLTNDTLTAYLPYFGQAFSAPINNANDGGIKFTSTKFDYTVTQKKKGGFEIMIRPNDLQPRAPSDVLQMILSVGEGGWASLQITLLTRQRISFSGIVDEVKPKQGS